MLTFTKTLLIVDHLERPCFVKEGLKLLEMMMSNKNENKVNREIVCA